MVEQIEVRECLLLFSAESFIFQFAIQKVMEWLLLFGAESFIFQFAIQKVREC
jgi:hypothetical protein